MLLTLFFAWNVSQTLEELEAKRSVIIYRAKATFISITRACALTIKYSVFFIMAGLIVEMLFMLFSIYKYVYVKISNFTVDRDHSYKK